jgi:hypothetical protein
MAEAYFRLRSELFKSKTGGAMPPVSYYATRFVTSRYFPLTGLTSGHGACTDLQRR